MKSQASLRVSPVADIDIVTSDFGVVAVILNPILGLFNLKK